MDGTRASIPLFKEPAHNISQRVHDHWPVILEASHSITYIGYNMVYSWLCKRNEPQSTVDNVVTYLFHDHSPDGDWHLSILSCKLLALSRETKLTLSVALNPKSKLTLECGTNLTNHNTRACLSNKHTLRHPQQGDTPVISSTLFRRHEVGVRGWGE